ncbi:hypothetical protein PG997_003763 [Apiospora hydei]|uniref:Uncharacterized protein n=1 Tax=Apiospora hydei TaxID=1337664 RepID=A0ABR1X0B6_9PEZI
MAGGQSDATSDKSRHASLSTEGQRRALKHAPSVTAKLKTTRWANGEEKEPWRVLVDKQRSAVVSE